MTPDRIEINGVWYVKAEADDSPTNKIKDIEVHYNLDCFYETENYVFTASKLYMDGLDSDFYGGVTIEFTDKRPDERDKWKTDFWDNEKWILGVYNNNQDIDALCESIKKCKKIFKLK
jgi:hypothetical protein